jgi:head-tail adaptor
MNLNGKVFNPGEMNVQIVVATRSVGSDAGGFKTKTHPFLAQVWAKWTNVHGTEAWTAGALGAEAAATVMIRYLAGLDNTCVVVKGATVSDVVEDEVVTGKTYSGGEMYEIVSMDNIGERGEYIELKVKRIKAG